MTLMLSLIDLLPLRQEELVMLPLPYYLAKFGTAEGASKRATNHDWFWLCVQCRWVLDERSQAWQEFASEHSVLQHGSTGAHSSSCYPY